MKIYHNPRCKKSRETLKRIQENGTEPEIIKYLDTPPSKEEMRDILGKLGMNASDIIRKTEKIYKEEFKGRELSEEEWLGALQQYPKLMQRPIVVEGEDAVIGRPPENVDRLFS